jgi:hypothetical protein
MNKLTNLHASGVIKQGEKVFDIDCTVGTVSVWSLALCKINGLLVAFAKHSSGLTYSPADLNLHANFVRDNADAPAVLAALEAIKPYCLTPTAAAGLVYVTDATETGLYFDGVNKITTAPVTPQTTADILKQALGGSGNGTDTTPAGDLPKWYTKPLNIVLMVAGAIGIGLLIKKFA